MSSKFAYLIASCYLLAAARVVVSASTREVYLESDLKVKPGSSQEDLDQFFEDQPHLTGDKQDADDANQAGLVVGGPLSGIPFLDNIMNFYQLTSMLSQLGLPMISPSSIAQMLVQDPMDLFGQFLADLGVRRQAIPPDDNNHTIINKI